MFDRRRMEDKIRRRGKDWNAVVLYVAVRSSRRKEVVVEAVENEVRNGRLKKAGGRVDSLESLRFRLDKRG